jgi:hypothetical protein
MRIHSLLGLTVLIVSVPSCGGTDYRPIKGDAGAGVSFGGSGGGTVAYSGGSGGGGSGGCATEAGEVLCGPECCTSGFACVNGDCVASCADGRYYVLNPGKTPCSCVGSVATPGDPECRDGSGLVGDTTTGLTWMRYFYFTSVAGLLRSDAQNHCLSKNMRLPTKDEALQISGKNYDGCAFPCDWDTWTSSDSDQNLMAWVVRHDGSTSEEYYSNASGVHVLCVRD